MGLCGKVLCKQVYSVCAFFFPLQLCYKQDGEIEKITFAVKIQSMTKEEVEETIAYVSSTFDGSPPFFCQFIRSIGPPLKTL